MRSHLAVALAVVAAVLVVGSGGFTAVSADRAVTVEVVGDANAYMALEYADTEVPTDGGATEFVTVRNQFAQPVDATVTYSVDAGSGLSVPDGEQTAARDGLGVGDAATVSTTLTCTSPGTHDATVSFHATADGEGVYAETTAPRTVEFAVDCRPAVTVRFQGNGGNARVDGVQSLDDTTATVWLLDDGTLTSEAVAVTAKGGENVRPVVDGQGAIVAVSLAGTGRTYVHPDLERRGGSLALAPPARGGSNDPADPVCEGRVDPSTLPTDDGDLACPA
ncbi:hypothetical protein [Haloarcula litorea]|uniref:hypothetical protein n=1 Tax=Haloarcula litorea TaxID=3032579 RepID=UPI0023E81C45|nr:hypothetical protein [Halomicroarcula sp. GDY20]